MAIIVVLERSGIEPTMDRWYFRIQGDPTQGLGLKCGIGSLAVQEDSTPKAKVWEKTSGTDTGWAAVTATASTQANKVSLEQYGSFAGGVADSTIDAASTVSALNALAALGGGILELYQQYAVPAAGITLTGDGYANIRIVARTPGAGWYRSTDNPTNDGTAVITIQGANPYSLKNVVFDGVTFSGHSTSDYSKLIVASNTDGLYFDRCRFLNNAVEGLYLPGQNHCKNTFVTNCYAANVGVGSVKLSAYNLTSDTCLLANSTAINCGQGCEQDGRNARILGNHFENISSWGVLAMSTWASWIDVDGTTVLSSNNVLIQSNTFIACHAAIGVGDFTGHTVNSTPVPGAQGRLVISNNTVITCGEFFDGGADSLQEVVIRDNYCDDAPSGDNYCLTAHKGRFVIEGNVFRLGATSAWAGVIRCGDQDAVNTSAVIQYNTIIGRCWTGQAFLLGPEVTLGRNLFENVAVSPSTYYGWAGSDHSTDGDLSDFVLQTDTWMVQSDPDMVFSNTQPSRMRVNGAPPAKGTWKAGDAVTNIAATGVQGWRCTLAGTFDTIKSGVTISTTSGSKVATVTAGLTKVTKYQWVTIAGVTGRYQLAAYDPATGIASLSSNAAATVTSGAAAYSTGAWQPAGLASVTTAVTTTYTVGANDQILYYTAAAPYTITLPVASVSEGLSYTFLRADNSGFVVTIAAAGSDTINGSATYVPPVSQFFAATLICTNGSWTYRTNKPVMADLQSGTATGSGYIFPDITVTGGITNNLPRFDAGNSGSAKTLTWTAARRQQKCTLSAATPAITIDDTVIPSGEYLVTDLFQDATGSRIPTFALTSGGTPNPVGGAGPTLTTTAGKADRIVWENEGTRITYWLGLQNF